MGQQTTDNFPENISWTNTNLKVKSIEAGGITIPNPDLPDFDIIPRYMRFGAGRLDGSIILLGAEPNDGTHPTNYSICVKDLNDEIVTSWEIPYDYSGTTVNLGSYFVSGYHYVEVGSDGTHSAYGIQYLKLTS